MNIGRPQRIIEIEPVSLPVPGPSEPLIPTAPSEPRTEPVPDVRPDPLEPVPADPAHLEPTGPPG